MSSRTARILENARLLFLPSYETTKGLDPYHRNLAIKHWSEKFGSVSNDISDKKIDSNVEDGSTVQTSGLCVKSETSSQVTYDYHVSPIKELITSENNDRCEYLLTPNQGKFCKDIPLGVVTPNNHSTMVGGEPGSPRTTQTATDSRLATVNQNTKIYELNSDESESSYVASESAHSSSDEDFVGHRRKAKRKKSKHVTAESCKIRTKQNRAKFSNTKIDADTETQEGIYLQIARKTDTNKRIYDKRHICYFCNKPYIKMARHIETCHSNENEVTKLLTQPKKSVQRRKGFIKIMRAGDFQHNIEVLASHSGELVLLRRPSEEFTTYQDYGPCPHCLGFMLKKHIWHHIRKCEESNVPEQVRKYVMTDSNSLLISILQPSISQRFRDNILSGMMNDVVSLVCRNDDLIVRFGALQYEKYCDTQKDLIRQSMRQLGRLVIKLREVNEESKTKSLTDFITPANFDAIIETVKILCRQKVHVTSRPQYDIPSLALKLGHHLRKCVGILRGVAIRQGRNLQDVNLKNFLQLLDMEWSARISSNALSTLYTRKMNVAELLPLTSDLMKLNEYILKEIECGIEELTNSTDKNVWQKLAKFTLARIVLFNKRRSGEVSRMLICNYNSKPDWNSKNSQELINSLSDVEKKLANKLTLIEVIGKRGRKVPVLLTQEMITAVEKLSSKRKDVGIAPDNVYVFARPFGGSLGYLRASDCLRNSVNEVQLEAPELIKGTKLRKYIATVTQVINLKENETDWLARHLGHDIRVHTDIYRLHESAVELTKVSRLLLAVDEGHIQNFAGKSLEDIELGDLPDMEPEADLHKEIGELGEIGETEEIEEEDHDQHNINAENAGQPSTSSIKPGRSSVLPKRGKRTRKNFTRRMWQPDEIKAVTKYFHTEIRKGIVPGKERIMMCKEEYNNVLDTRSWKDVKYYVKNFISKLKSNKK